MKDPAHTWNAVVVDEDPPCWPGIRRHEHLTAGSGDSSGSGTGQN